MRITLAVIRKTLRRGLGQECFTAGFIKEVSEDLDHASASITRDGRLRYNPTFIEKHVTSPEDLFALLLHELLHPLWAHFLRSPGKVENIAADAVINAAITTLYADQSANGHLFRSVYRRTGLEAILRPDSSLEGDSLERVYRRLYPFPYPDETLTSSYPLTTGVLIRNLKILVHEDEVDPGRLLGSHKKEPSGERERRESESTTWDRDVLAHIARDLKGALSDAGGIEAGRGAQLYDLLSKVLDTRTGIREDLLLRFATRQVPDRLLEKRHFSPQQRVSPIPLRPSRGQMVLLAGGAYPLHYHRTIYQETAQHLGVAVYLDVSGSATHHLPRILGVLRRLRGRLSSIFQFSNLVVETTLESLLAGEVQTTYGTDFDCVAQSILERGFQRAIVITDGYANLSRSLRDELLQRGTQVLTVLFGHARTCDPLAALGDVVGLEKVCA